MVESGAETPIRVPADGVILEGDLAIPDNASGVVLFAHGSGSGRHSPRNRFVAQQLRSAGLATLLLDLLTTAEEEAERKTRHLRFDIDLLAGHLQNAADWLRCDPRTKSLPIGAFGASTGAGAALQAAAQQPGVFAAVVSRGGRPDLAGELLSQVFAPTLLIVGGLDDVVLVLNRAALDRLGASDKKLIVVPGATHLFEEPGTLEEVARLATAWFRRFLRRSSVE